MIPMAVSNYHQVKVLSNHISNSNEPVSYSSDKLDIDSVEADSFHDQISSIFDSIKLFNPDIIHLFSRANLISFVRHIKHRFPYISLIVDIRSPLLEINNAKTQAIRKKYNKVQYYVDHIITCDEDSLKTFIAKPIVDFTVVPVGVDLDMFPKSAGITANHKITKFVFVGSIFKKRKIGSLVEFFNLLCRKSNRSINLDIFGDGDDCETVLNLIKKYKNSNIRYLGIIPQDELFLKLSEYDAGIAYVPHESYSMAPSLKSIEYSAAGISVLASDTTGHAKYNDKHGFCFELFPNTKKGFVNVFKKVIEKGFPVEHIKKNKSAVEFFDWNYLTKKNLIPVYEKLYRIRHKGSNIFKFKD